VAAKGEAKEPEKGRDLSAGHVPADDQRRPTVKRARLLWNVAKAVMNIAVTTVQVAALLLLVGVVSLNPLPIVEADEGEPSEKKSVPTSSTHDIEL